jgi:hypothetical protein
MYQVLRRAKKDAEQSASDAMALTSCKEWNALVITVPTEPGQERQLRSKDVLTHSVYAF